MKCESYLLCHMMFVQERLLPRPLAVKSCWADIYRGAKLMAWCSGGDLKRPDTIGTGFRSAIR